MDQVIRVCKNIYECKKRTIYIVRITLENKIYQKSFGYTKDGKRLALQKAIKYKREQQLKLGIKRQTQITNKRLVRKNKWIILEPNIYHNENNNTIVVSIKKDNTNYRKVFTINNTRPFSVAVSEAKSFKNNIYNNF